MKTVDWRFVAVSAFTGAVLGMIWSALGYSPKGKR